MPCRGPSKGLTVVRSPHLEKLGPQNKKLQGVLLDVCKTTRSSARCLQDWQYIIKDILAIATTSESR